MTTERPSIQERLMSLRKAAILSDPYDADTQLNIKIELIQIIDDIQREGKL